MCVRVCVSHVAWVRHAFFGLEKRLPSPKKRRLAAEYMVSSLVAGGWQPQWAESLMAAESRSP